jgi:hypothetical protein
MGTRTTNTTAAPGKTMLARQNMDPTTKVNTLKATIVPVRACLRLTAMIIGANGIATPKTAMNKNVTADHSTTGSIIFLHFM